MANGKELEVAILEAIKAVTEKSNEYRVSYGVRHALEKDLFKSKGKEKIYIDITLERAI